MSLAKPFYHYYLWSADLWWLIKTYQSRSGARRAQVRDGARGWKSVIFSHPIDDPPATMTDKDVRREWARGGNACIHVFAARVAPGDTSPLIGHRNEGAAR